MQCVAKVLVALSTLTLMAGCATRGPAWPVRHADTANSDYLYAPAASSLLESAWEFAPGVPIGTFAAVGRGSRIFTHSYGSIRDADSVFQGCHLWAIDAESGRVDWCSADVGPALTSIALGPDDAVFVADTQYLYGFTSTGVLQWKTAILSETSGISWLGANLLIADYDGHLTLRDPGNGKAVSLPFRLPAAPYKDGPITADFALGQLKGGVDPEYLPRLIRNFFGYGIRIKDMPAVDQDSGAIFLTANGDTPDEGRLFRLSFDSGSRQFSVDCEARLGPSIDASPTLSADGSRVYTVSEGFLRAHRSDDCRLAWESRQPGSSYASPAVSPDGTIYLMAGGSLSAIRDMGEMATTSWRIDADIGARREGFEHGVFDSVPILSGDRLFVAGTYGLDQGEYTFPLAHRLFVINSKSGAVLQSLPLGEESDSTPSLSREGLIFVPTKALSLGHAHSLAGAGMLDPTLRDLLRPQIFNGIYAFRPVDRPRNR